MFINRKVCAFKEKYKEKVCAYLEKVWKKSKCI